MLELDRPLPRVQGTEEAIVFIGAYSCVPTFKCQVTNWLLHLFRDASLGHTNAFVGVTMDFKLVFLGLVNDLDDGWFSIKGSSMRWNHTFPVECFFDHGYIALSQVKQSSDGLMPPFTTSIRRRGM